MKRPTLIMILMAGSLAVTWFFPLFHVVSLEELRTARSAAKFDAADFAREFWEKQLVPVFDQAADAAELINQIKADPKSARTTHGKTVGIGRSYFYFLRGEGNITAVDKAAVAVSCVAPDDQPEVLLKTGLLFGNTIRDATGQLKAGDFANSQDFNAISKELNRRVEEQVQPSLKDEAQVGQRVRFVGCAEIRASSSDVLPLTVIPLQVEFPE